MALTKSCICTIALFTYLVFYCSQITVVGQTVEPNNDFFCSDAFCPEYVRQYPCSTSGANCNTTGFREFLDPDTCNCCPYCFDYLKENATCSPKSLEKPVEMCGPHLQCIIDPDSPTAACKQMEGKKEDDCMTKRNSYLEHKVGIVQFLPECDAHGDYAPRQCLPGSLCYCSNKKGEKIFGESRATELQDCACSRDIARLKEFGFDGTWPHCMPNGDYDELQCVVRSCYCKSYPTIIYNPQNLHRLKCFNPDIHIYDPESTRYYTRECEHKRAKRLIEILEAEVAGIIMISQDVPQCSPDDCARARNLLKESATGLPKCLPNGNYRADQCVGSTCYCVDELGRQVIDLEPFEVPDDQVQTLPCYVR